MFAIHVLYRQFFTLFVRFILGRAIFHFKLSLTHLRQYCQNWSVNILTRVCREFTRLGRSKHTLVNILIIDVTITKIILLVETQPNQDSLVRILTRVYSQNID